MKNTLVKKILVLGTAFMMFAMTPVVMTGCVGEDAKDTAIRQFGELINEGGQIVDEIAQTGAVSDEEIAADAEVVAAEEEVKQAEAELEQAMKTGNTETIKQAEAKKQQAQTKQATAKEQAKVKVATNNKQANNNNYLAQQTTRQNAPATQKPAPTQAPTHAPTQAPTTTTKKQGFTGVKELGGEYKYDYDCGYECSCGYRAKSDSAIANHMNNNDHGSYHSYDEIAATYYREEYGEYKNGRLIRRYFGPWEKQ